MPSPSQIQEQLQAALGDAYTVDRELGGGGMSRVFVARDLTLKREVVVKALAPEMVGGVNAERFQREIEVSARLTHPNIVPLLSAGDAAGWPYYTMPLVAGESLRARLQRETPLPVRDAVAILRDVARALAYAHAQGVVHRDIKPDNVLLAGDYAVVTDFGVAKALAASQTASADDTAAGFLTMLGITLGTPAYMPPEQAAGDPATGHRADLYAFGVMAYEMLAGEMPITAKNAQALLAAHATQTPASLMTLRPSIPPALSALVMRCLAKLPADRPRDADEIVRVLDAVSSSMSSGTAEAVVGAPAAFRQRMYWIIAVLVVALLAIAGVFFARSRTSAAVSTNANVVAVVPFRVTATDPMLQSLREGMLDLIAAKLTGAIRAADTRTALAAWRKAGGKDARDLDEPKAIAAMRSIGAGKMIQGDILQAGSGVTIHGILIDLSSPRRRVEASATGVPTAIAMLVDTVVAKLLVQGAGESDQTASMLASIPLPALQAYVVGEAAYRRGRYQEASDAFARAIEIDSTFALAGFHLRLASDWSLDRRGPLGLAVARKHRDKLGRVDALLLTDENDMSCAGIAARYERATQAAPDVPEAWYSLADKLTHCGFAMGLDSEATHRALAGFNRALALDSSFIPALEHVPMLYAFLGDTTNARRALSLLPDTRDFLPANRYIVSDDPKARSAALAALEKKPMPQPALFALIAIGYAEVPRPEDSERLLAAAAKGAVTESDRALVAHATRLAALAFGQPHRAAAAIPASGDGPAAYVVDAVFGDGDSVAAVRALPEIMRAALSPPPSSADAQNAWVTAAFAAAEYGLASGRASDTTARIITALRSFTDARQTSRARRFAMLLDAQTALLTKRPDATRLVASVDSMLVRVDGGEYNESAGNLIAVRLWERLGEPRRAYAASKRLTMSANPPPYVATYARERARFATVVGDTADALRQYRRYLAMRPNPEPSLVADRDNAKRELARLESQTRGR